MHKGKEKRKIVYLAFMLSCLCAFGDVERPKWGLFGDDNGLRHHINDSDCIVSACVYDIEVIERKINGQIISKVDILYKLTVTKTYKGKLAVGEKIDVVFSAELPLDPKVRGEHVRSRNKEIKGDLIIAFLYDDKKGYRSEYFMVPAYTKELNDFLLMEVLKPAPHNPRVNQ